MPLTRFDPRHAIGHGLHTGDARRRLVMLMLMLLAVSTACASGGWYAIGPRPASLVGTWVDSTRSTPRDTVGWVLAASGEDRTLRVRADSAGTPVATLKTARYGLWYLIGTLGDTTSQALCVERNVRRGSSCFRFRLDTLRSGAAAMARRRLWIYGPAYRHQSTLLERDPQH